jgi:hypothetical protein
MTHHPESRPGITWAAARRIADARLDALEAQWRASGIDPATMAGVAGPVATYASQADYAALRPEDQPGSVSDHDVIVSATVKEARRRYGLRLVPMTIDAAGYLRWLDGRENTAAARAAYVAEQFAAHHFEP